MFKHEVQKIKFIVILNYFKTVCTIDNHQRLVFPLGVSQHRYKITDLSKFELSRSSKLRDNHDRKQILSHKVVCVQVLAIPQTLKLRSRNQNFVENYSFSKTMCLQREPFLTMFLFYQQLRTTRYQVTFYANTYFEQLTIVSTAFKSSECCCQLSAYKRISFRF